MLIEQEKFEKIRYSQLKAGEVYSLINFPNCFYLKGICLDHNYEVNLTSGCVAQKTINDDVFVLKRQVKLVVYN